MPMVWDILECLGNQGRLGLPTVGGMERRGCTWTHQTRGMGEGLVGGSRDLRSAGIPGNWQGQRLGRGWDTWS